MICVAEADCLLAGLLPVATFETVPLAQAVGRCLAQPLLADRDGPPFDRVVMDGYAIDSREGLGSWSVQALQYAGNPPLDLEGQAAAIETATGAVLPRGCDAVVPYEAVDRQDDTVSLKPSAPLPSSGQFVHRQGSDYRKADLLLPAGTLLRSPHLHSLASSGMDPVPVVRRPVWALISTGDELVEVRDEPLAWQIRRSNTAAIAGEAGAWGLAPRHQVLLADDKIRLRQGLEQLLPGLDVLVLTGGVSAGARDLVPGILTEMGASTVFHKVDQRPGKPLWVGQLPESKEHPRTVIFGLPGNPVSSLFAFRRYVLPWLLTAEGRPPEERSVEVSGLTPPQTGQTLFLPWSHRLGTLPWFGSGDFSALADSDGFIELNSEPQSLVRPRFYPWGGTQ